VNKIKRVILLALLLRLVGIFIFRNIDNYDLKSYFQIGELTFKGINIYPRIANLHHPYFPFFLYVEAFVFWLTRNKLIFITIIKFINVLFDLGNLYLIYLLSKKNPKSAFFYAINPVSILIFTLHGQFDAIPLFFLLLSLVTLRVTKHENPWTPLGCLIFSMAVMIKTWPLLFVISVYKRLRNKKLIILVLLFPLISVIIYSLLFKTSIINIVNTIVNYQGLWGKWGLWGLLGKWRLRWQKISTLIFLLSFFVYSYLNKKRNILKEILYLLLFFFAFTTNFSVQYFSWLMPFLAIIRPKYYWFLTLAITIFLSFSYASWIFPLISPTVLITFSLTLWIYLASFFWMAYRKK